MLKICLTPTTLVFRNLTDELQQQITDKFGFEFDFNKKNEAFLEDEPKKLYKMLYLLSTYYDIEII